jgi:hypothetical protein
MYADLYVLAVLLAFLQTFLQLFDSEKGYYSHGERSVCSSVAPEVRQLTKRLSRRCVCGSCKVDSAALAAVAQQGMSDCLHVAQWRQR